MSAPAATPTRHIYLAVTVAALGYFVDVFDLILVNVVRGPSISDMGVPKVELLDKGELVVNMQMLGMLIGGLAWGALGDKRGRLSVLFGSIILYSIANIVNAHVSDLTQYAAVRFVAGFGLAGELGAGVTLVNEIMSKEGRGWGPTIIAAIGILGGVFATLLGGALPGVWSGVDWRTAYTIGGVMGLALLILRIGVHESGLFKQVASKAVSRGNFLRVFATGARAKRYISIVLVGLPIWYIIGILSAAAPEIGQGAGMTLADRPRALMFCYIFLGVGDLLAGGVSQWLRSRRMALGIFVAATAVTTVAYFTIARSSREAYFVAISAVSLAGGYWAIFVITASEQFGTNLRATTTTTAPNFVRGGLVLMNALFHAFRDATDSVVTGAWLVGVIVIGLAIIGLFGIEETFGKDLDFLEE
ncbi:MAG TPA: MFS transporter [Kofleriaceae bacterium]|nr:MFS transporter [Kofleriaceae bacterium]